jgi:HEPN domain-containing protein
MRGETKQWLNTANYDIETAKHMFATGRYIYVIFMCHLAIEKVLKALVVEETYRIPPKSHDLLLLADKAKVSLSTNFKEFIGIINTASIVTRYPEDITKLTKSLKITSKKQRKL